MNYKYPKFLKDSNEIFETSIYILDKTNIYNLNNQNTNIIKNI